MQHYVIKVVSDLQEVRGFLRVSSTNKTDRHDITEILLNAISLTLTQSFTYNCIIHSKS